MEKEACVVAVVVVGGGVCATQGVLYSVQPFGDSGCFHCQCFLGVFYSPYGWKSKREQRERDGGGVQVRCHTFASHHIPPVELDSQALKQTLQAPFLHCLD